MDGDLNSVLNGQTQRSAGASFRCVARFSRFCQRSGLPALILLTITGCATSSHLVEDFGRAPRSRDSLVYAGTKYHLHEIPLYSTRARMHWGSQIGYSLRWWHYIDLPLCVCADTILLPYTIPRTVYTHWASLPTEEEIAVRPFIEETSACTHNMRDLEVGKLMHTQRHGLGPTDSLPQDLDTYRAQVDVPYNKGPFYVCPASGEYTVGGQGDEPACSVHGSLSDAMEALEFMCRTKRVPSAWQERLERHEQTTPAGVEHE